MLVCLPNENATCEVIKLYPYYELQTLLYKVKYTVTHCYTVFYVSYILNKDKSFMNII